MKVNITSKDKKILEKLKSYNFGEDPAVDSLIQDISNRNEHNVINNLESFKLIVGVIFIINIILAILILEGAKYNFTLAPIGSIASIIFNLFALIKLIKLKSHKVKK